MKLLVIVLCLLSERYLTHKSALHRFAWFGPYCSKIIAFLPKRMPFKNPWVMMSLLIIPWLILTAIVLGLLNGYVYGLFGLLIQLLIFYCCMGPENLFYPISHEKKTSSHEDEEAGHYLALANNQLFGVIFWYIVLGPIAILAYRLISLSQKRAPLSSAATYLTNLLDWIPARLTALFYCLVGNFQQAYLCLLKKSSLAPSENNTLLAEAGLLAASTHKNEKVSLTTAQDLVLHAILITLVFIALFTMVSWL